MARLPDPDKARRQVGFLLYLIALLVGGVLLLAAFLLPPALEGNVAAYGYMCFAACLAFPAAAMYLTVPRLLDRYDPEPWYALVGCLLWGGIPACGFSAIVNTGASGVGHLLGGAQTADVVAAVISAPIVEEAFKGVGVAGIFFFVRREFDGIVDGIIYGTFVALGFAAVENVLYYARAAEAGQDMLAMTVLMRGVLGPWGHPLYTSMTGIGFGLARETDKRWVRWAAPPAFYVLAVILHGVWNASATLAGKHEMAGAMFVCMLPIWFLFVATFIVLVIVLVRRRGRIIRAHLEDEVALGNLTREEVELVCSAFGLAKARLRYGKPGARFVRAAARLALSKWHTTRAHRESRHTFSMEFIVPLREELRALRHALKLP